MDTKLRRLLERLEERGFPGLPKFELRRDDSQAMPLVVVTGGCMTPFNAAVHYRSKTKTYFTPTGESHFLNQGAALAIAMIERGERVILHVNPGNYGVFKDAIRHHPNAPLLTILTGELGSFSFVASLYGAISEFAARHPISEVRLCLYESFSAKLPRDRAGEPFLPVYLESAQNIRTLVADRGEFVLNMALVALDLLIRHNQPQMRLVMISALASVRPGGNLAVDALHKVVGSTLLRILAIDAAWLLDRNELFVVEIMPGIVDGMYDTDSVRKTTFERTLPGVPPFEPWCGEELERFPQLSAGQVAEVADFYLQVEPGVSSIGRVSDEITSLTNAGRSYEELTAALESLIVDRELGCSISEALPAYCLTPGVTLGQLPALTPGYIPVPLVPRGQLF